MWRTCESVTVSGTQEKNLTIKDIYGQEVVDAFFKTEASSAVEQAVLVHPKDSRERKWCGYVQIFIGCTPNGCLMATIKKLWLHPPQPHTSYTMIRAM